MKSPQAFSLLEVMVAVALAGVLAATVTATFKGSLDEQARSKHEWQAFTIAQQMMEKLSALPRSHELLAHNTVLVAGVPGTAADATCPMGLGAQHKMVNGLGDDASGPYEMCVKVTDGHPSGNLKDIRVVVLYKTLTGNGNVLLQTIR